MSNNETTEAPLFTLLPVLEAFELLFNFKLVDTSYSTRHVEFVTGHNGTTKWEVSKIGIDAYDALRVVLYSVKQNSFRDVCKGAICF